MADDSPSKAPGVPLEFLAKVENLIRATGHTALLIVRTVLLAPQFFFNRRVPPTEAIAQAVATGRALPPLLYLTLMAPLVPIGNKLLRDMFEANDAAARLREGLRQLGALDAAGLAWQVAPTVLGIWLLAEACAWLLARMTGRPRAELSQALLFCYAMLFSLSNVGLCIILPSLVIVDGPLPISPATTDALLTMLFVIGAAAAGLLGWQLMQDSRRTLADRARALRLAAMAVAIVLPAASFISTAMFTLKHVDDTDRPDLAQQIADTLAPVDSASQDRARHIIVTQGRHCRLRSPQELRCSLLLRPFQDGALMVVEMTDPRLTVQRTTPLPPKATQAQREGVRQPLRIDWLWPELGRGQWLKLGGTEPTAVEISVTTDALCQALGQLGATTQELDKATLRLDLLGIRLAKDHFNAQPEPHRLSLPIPEDARKALRQGCGLPAGAGAKAASAGQ